MLTGDSSGYIAMGFATTATSKMSGATAVISGFSNPYSLSNYAASEDTADTTISSITSTVSGGTVWLEFTRQVVPSATTYVIFSKGSQKGPTVGGSDSAPQYHSWRTSKTIDPTPSASPPPPSPPPPSPPPTTTTVATTPSPGNEDCVLTVNGQSLKYSGCTTSGLLGDFKLYYNDTGGDVSAICNPFYPFFL